MDLLTELTAKGWYLSNKGLEICKEGLNHVDVNGIIRKALDIDLREIGGKFFPDESNRGKLDSISGSGVVQIQKIKNASAPKYEYGSGAPPILRLLLTDGNVYVNCLQWGPWKSITMDTPPGTKIFLKPGKITMQNNFLLLSENQFNLLDGHVAPMVEKWELCRQLASHVRTKGNLDGNGPPPWIPFGKPITATKQPMKGKNFRALETETKETKEEDEAFKQQRLANIAEVARVKEGKPKVFGGGKDKQSNTKPESNFPHNLSGNSSDTANHAKPYRNFNEYDNRQPPRNQNDYKYPRNNNGGNNHNNRNGKNWAHQDAPRTQVPPENSTQGQFYSKDKRMDQRNKFQNDFQNPRNQNTHQQQRTFNSNTYRGNDSANSSKKFSKGSNFYENSRTSSDRPYGNDHSNVEDLSQRISSIKLHGYDHSNEGTVTIPNKPFIIPGAEVLAKYWEDHKFYPAKVTGVGPEGKTCVVFFTDYGNYEEVVVDDVQEMQVQSNMWNVGPISFQPSHWNGRERDQDFRSSSDYQDNRHRSGQGQRRHDGHRQQRHDDQRQQQQRHDFRPSVKLYQPPQQRHPS
uniref:Tudor domain-containing protein 3 n=1 Tax=Parasteatoda tepidariorum TaxID=114398 RepID=A0A2L2XW75_PARTP